MAGIYINYCAHDVLSYGTGTEKKVQFEDVLVSLAALFTFCSCVRLKDYCIMSKEGRADILGQVNRDV